jgi:hypothetical protein
MTAVTTADLTTASIEGNGIFDVLMRAAAAHLEAEFNKNRIKGTEYSEVYLGSMTQVMQTALQFLVTKEKIDLEAQLLQKQIEQAAAQTELINQQKLNAIAENAVLVAQECKLRAEYDLTMASITRTNEETALMTQKVATERAQTTALGVDADSIVGRQKGLYLAQTDGFKRDAEQKAAKVLVDSWNVRRTTDEGTVADSTNMLNDASVGRAVNKLLAGVGA